MTKVLVAVVLFLGSLVPATPKASAYLTSCRTWIYRVAHGYGMSRCENHINNGGNNLQRVVIGCKYFQGSLVTYILYGPWVLEDYTSVKYCETGYVPVEVSYQLL